MTSTEEKLKAICSELLKMSEHELMRLLPIYHRRMESFDSLKEWEEATIIFFLINGLRIKNIQLPEKIKELNSHIRIVDNKFSLDAKNPLEVRPNNGQILNDTSQRIKKDSTQNTKKPSLRLVK
jgi:hypothetical protein